MTDTALDPEEGADTEYPYCEAIPGMGPHDYQGVADIIGGTGLYMVCTQCGDYFLIDGTASPTGGLWGNLFPTQSQSAPAPSPSTSPSISPSGTKPPPWVP